MCLARPRRDQLATEAVNHAGPGPPQSPDPQSPEEVPLLAVQGVTKRFGPVLVMSSSTRGLDVRTTERTRSLIVDARDRDTAVVLVSEDLDELLTLSDRIAVLSRGRISGEVNGADADHQALGRLMTWEAV